ncbi:hypothetical protein MIND_00688700 [Mycena indigotica]|uniref:LIM-domain binding protein-domain-containing protein n=1 Tax=Mycena indigotica TaxID=2126181 RepID=A0A8H6W6M4_9AGAR|nr:uncharacterized protein MIND_00688700 [Mycena indigotica]KAF7301239.1 hypothetical protein MIND_00688700 [Mycena indigotica]
MATFHDDYNPILRQGPQSFALNNPAFQQPGNPPMAMLQGGRFPPNMDPRSLPMRGGPGRPMNPAMSGMPPAMNPGMGFPPNMMPGPVGTRRVASNPGLMTGNPQHIQQQQQQNMQRMMMQQQQVRQAEMMRGLVGTPTRPPGQQLMNSLGQPNQAFANPPPPSPRSHTPVMGGGMPQRVHPDTMFNDFPPQNQFPPRASFPFGGSPVPPEQFPPGAPRNAGGFPTPTQLSMQHPHDNNFFIPSRPLSQQQHHPEPMPRPQSQPQQPQQPPGRPLSSAAGPSQPPRPAGNVRMPPQPPQPLPPSNQRPESSGSSSHPQPIAPRPPTQGPPPPASDGTLLSASASPPDANAVLTQTVPRPPAADMTALSLGHGQGLFRVMQFSGVLGSDTPQILRQKLNLSFWHNMIQEYFTPKAIMKLTLWRDSMKNEAKPFEIGVPILPRFFLVTTQSGVKSMSFSLDGARERLYAPGHAIIECVAAVWTCRYNNGHVVTLRGPLIVHLVLCAPAPGSTASGTNPQFVIKFDDFEFDAHSHDKYIALDSIAGTRREEESPAASANGMVEEDKQWEEPRAVLENASIPGEPVNAFGIPQATMRCLELAESVGQMQELITFAKEHDMGPLSALKSFTDKLREEHPQQAIMNGAPPNSFFQGSSSLPGTLYSSAPPSVTNPPPPQPTSSMSSPQNQPPSAANSPQKQLKTIPAKGSVASASTPTASTSGGTPSLPAASLKRKEPPAPATEQSSKRSMRRRRATGGGS